jgi:hypothetical protein
VAFADYPFGETDYCLQKVLTAVVKEAPEIANPLLECVSYETTDRAQKILQEARASLDK